MMDPEELASIRAMAQLSVEDYAHRLGVTPDALERMEEGTYGVSEVSGKVIPAERLEVLPWATKRVDE